MRELSAGRLARVCHNQPANNLIGNFYPEARHILKKGNQIPAIFSPARERPCRIPPFPDLQMIINVQKNGILRTIVKK
jgi:hypothetical protein